MSGPPKLLLATGGSGGHIYPALAVARAAEEQGAAVSFIGSAGGMEERLVGEAGLPFFGVRAGKWDRQRPDPREGIRALSGLTAALRHVRSERPDLLIGFGGFASFPGCVAAVLTNRPLMLHEGNAFPSRVNRWFAPRAELIVSAQAEALPRLKGVKRSQVIPFPVREERVERSEARRLLGLPEEAVVTLVMGGSQGSLPLNEAVPEAFKQLQSLAGVNELGEHHVLHSTGPRWFDELARRHADLPNYHLEPYLNATHAWAAADLAITRAGVGTISEAAYHGVPLLLVPLPTAAEDHQLHNARSAVEAGTAMLLEQRDLDRLAEVWLTALAPPWRSAAAESAAKRSPAGAAQQIAAAALEIVGS